MYTLFKFNLPVSPKLQQFCLHSYQHVKREIIQNLISTWWRNMPVDYRVILRNETNTSVIYNIPFNGMWSESRIQTTRRQMFHL